MCLEPVETTKRTVIILNFLTNEFVHKSADVDQSDQGLNCLIFHSICISLRHHTMVEPLSLNV